MIGPVKQEDEWDQPRIVRYHDVVSDKEMEKVKELAKPRVSLSTQPLLLQAPVEVSTRGGAVEPPHGPGPASFSLRLLA